MPGVSYLLTQNSNRGHAPFQHLSMSLIGGWASGYFLRPPSPTVFPHGIWPFRPTCVCIIHTHGLGYTLLLTRVPSCVPSPSGSCVVTERGVESTSSPQSGDPTAVIPDPGVSSDPKGATRQQAGKGAENAL